MNIVKESQHADVRIHLFGFGPLGRPLMCVRCYAIDDILIDTAQHNMEKSVLSAVTRHPISRVLLTHYHEDHSGNAAAISRKTGADVIGHPLTSEKLAAPYPIFPYQHYIWGKSQPVAVIPFNRVVETDHYCFQVIHTPGHSKDHTVYFEASQGWLFAGDIYLGEKIKYFRSDENIYAQITSLKKILAYDFEVLFCCHNPVFTNGKRHLHRKMQYLEDFVGEIRKRLDNGESEKTIIAKLKKREVRTVKWMCMGNVSFANMIRSVYRDRPPE